MTAAHHPVLYQVNTRVWLTALSRGQGRPATLDDVPDGELDRLAGLGVEWVWLLSAWRTGEAGRRISRTNPEWRPDYTGALRDLTEEDIGGSGFAVTGYTASPALGGDEALARLRERLRRRGLRLMLDFVPNHTGLDHPWVEAHPDYYVAGTEEDLRWSPGDYVRVRGGWGERVLAHGRDPYFPGWPDTLQLDYSNRATREAMLGELLRVADRCDGVRCDMAMLVTPEVFERTWGRQAQAFWPRAIPAVKDRHPEFVLLAEVYWDLEWELQQQGFDFTYDKRLYDRLRAGRAGPVRDHLRAELDYQGRLARFLENHDEARAAAAFPPAMHEAAAAVTYLSPGMRFFHQGQFEGRRARISPHLVRGPDEPIDRRLEAFYGRLLATLREPALRWGRWELLDCVAAWDGNRTHENLIAFAWRGQDGERLVVAVNYSERESQGWVRLPFDDLRGSLWRLRDGLGPASYERHGEELRGPGLYLDVRPWQAHAFALTKAV